jgi:hypothetical protein
VYIIMPINRKIGSLEHPMMLNVEDNISKRYFDWGITPFIFITLQYLVSLQILDNNVLLIVATLEFVHVILNFIFDILTDEVMIMYDNENKFTFINVCIMIIYLPNTFVTLYTFLGLTEKITQ